MPCAGHFRICSLSEYPIAFSFSFLFPLAFSSASFFSPSVSFSLPLMSPFCCYCCCCCIIHAPSTPLGAPIAKLANQGGAISSSPSSSSTSPSPPQLISSSSVVIQGRTRATHTQHSPPPARRKNLDVSKHIPMIASVAMERHE